MHIQSRYLSEVLECLSLPITLRDVQAVDKIFPAKLQVKQIN